MSGKPWYTNGEIEIQVDVSKGEQIPLGFTHGRKKKDPKTSAEIIRKRVATLKSKSKEELAQIQEKRSNSLKEAHSKMSAQQRDDIIKKRKSTMSKKTPEERASINKRISIATIGKNAGKESWNKGLTADFDSRVKNISIKVSNTNKLKAELKKQEDPEYFINWRKDVSKTMKENGTYGKSKEEDEYYETLCSTYGIDNVIRQYSDPRYPFNCDFYIISEDLFIELNRHWTHGRHQFNPNDENDIEKLRK